MNPVIDAVLEGGHVARHHTKRDADKVSHEVPFECKKCKTPWPCAVIEKARKHHTNNIMGGTK